MRKEGEPEDAPTRARLVNRPPVRPIRSLNGPGGVLAGCVMMGKAGGEFGGEWRGWEWALERTERDASGWRGVQVAGAGTRTAKRRAELAILGCFIPPTTSHKSKKLPAGTRSEAPSVVLQWRALWPRQVAAGLRKRRSSAATLGRGREARRLSTLRGARSLG